MKPGACTITDRPRVKAALQTGDTAEWQGPQTCPHQQMEALAHGSLAGEEPRAGVGVLKARVSLEGAHGSWAGCPSSMAAKQMLLRTRHTDARGERPCGPVGTALTGEVVGTDRGQAQSCTCPRGLAGS